MLCRGAEVSADACVLHAINDGEKAVEQRDAERGGDEEQRRDRERSDEQTKGAKSMGKIADISKWQGDVDCENASGELDLVILRDGSMLCCEKGGDAND